jgi:hypothetical protein
MRTLPINGCCLVGCDCCSATGVYVKIHNIRGLPETVSLIEFFITVSLTYPMIVVKGPPELSELLRGLKARLCHKEFVS